MPRLVRTPEDARDLAAFLISWQDTALVHPAPGAAEWVADTMQVREGRTLFQQYQCQGCHRLEGTGGEVGPQLDGVGSRRKPAYVLALLRDPDSVIPGTAMENKHLWDSEARALTAFLSTLK